MWNHSDVSLDIGVVVNYKKGALDSQPQVIVYQLVAKVGGSLRVPQLPPPLKLVPMI
jgi:hypothetical protein